jgi:hypothetical protein
MKAPNKALLFFLSLYNIILCFFGMRQRSGGAGEPAPLPGRGAEPHKLVLAWGEAPKQGVRKRPKNRFSKKFTTPADNPGSTKQKIAVFGKICAKNYTLSACCKSA